MSASVTQPRYTANRWKPGAQVKVEAAKVKTESVKVKAERAKEERYAEAELLEQMHVA